MEPDAEKRLDRLEDKIDAINDKLVAFPVVGQRIDEIERRVGHIEIDLHDLRTVATDNRMGLVKIFSWIGMGGTFVILAIREAMRHIGPQ